MHLRLLNFKINQKVFTENQTYSGCQHCARVAAMSLLNGFFFFPKSKSKTKIPHKCNLLNAKSAVPPGLLSYPSGKTIAKDILTLRDQEVYKTCRVD